MRSFALSRDGPGSPHSTPMTRCNTSCTRAAQQATARSAATRATCFCGSEPLPPFAAALEAAQGLIGRYGYLRFQDDGPGHPARTRAVETVGAFAAHYFVKCPYGALCYALSPSVARAFLEMSRVLRAPVDQFIRRCWVHRQPLYGLLPYSVRGGPYVADSTIGARTKEPLPAGLRARRALHKVGTGFQRAVFNRRHASR